MINNKQIIEALQVQSLSEEEKASRHILGRLYGPIATTKESTRNGRTYNKALWEKALADDIFKEKIDTKSLFLELGHPANREETDMTCVCACIPEMPKIVEGDLYAYVDILDTPNGKLLKTLCDYGFVPGISSRGSGDVMANDEVDPETFFLETWDIVALPAVKKARLAMCESLQNGKTLNKALTESLDTAKEEEKEIMKEALDNLNINLTEEKDTDYQDIPWSESENNTALKEEDDEQVEIEDKEVDEIKDTGEEEIESDEEIINSEEDVEVSDEPVLTEMPVEEVVATVEEVADEIKDIVDADEETAEAIDEVVEDKKKELLPEEDEQSEDEESSEDNIESEPNEELVDETEETPEEAIDDGADEVIESLKKLVRQNGLLEAEVKSLKADKTVSNAEVNELKEKLNKYEAEFSKVTGLEEKLALFEKEVQSLKEQLTQKESEISTLKENAVDETKLTESVNARDSKIKSLTEKLDAMQKDLTAKDNKLTEQHTQYKATLNEAIKVATTYKDKYTNVLTHYIENRASMLGVKAADITRKLNENYTIKDIDAVCDELLDFPNCFSGNSFFDQVNNGAKIKLSESKQVAKTTDDDDINDLMIFAGLKK